MADAKAKTKRLQKRRKVWVTFKGEKRRSPAAVNATAADALSIAKWHGTKAVPMVEARPGDVVLSREDVKSFRGVCPIAYRHLRALLRGGR